MACAVPGRARSSTLREMARLPARCLNLRMFPMRSIRPLLVWTKRQHDIGQGLRLTLEVRGTGERRPGHYVAAGAVDRQELQLIEFDAIVAFPGILPEHGGGSANREARRLHGAGRAARGLEGFLAFGVLHVH